MFAFQQLYRPRPYRPVQVDPVLSSIHPYSNHGLTPKRKTGLQTLTVALRLQPLISRIVLF